MHSLDKSGIWHRLPVLLGIIYLAIRRHLHKRYNLFHVGNNKSTEGTQFKAADFAFRTADGEFNDPFNASEGSQGTFFGRNALPVDQKHKVREHVIKM